MKKSIGILLSSVVALGLVGCSGNLSKEDKLALQKKEQNLGKLLYHDKMLSKDYTQSCATCHNPKHGFIDERDNGVKGAGSLGNDGKSIGDRNAPTASYAMYSPDFHFNKKTGEYTGGQFWDGREPHLKGQAGGPPTNPVEMGMPSKEFMAKRLAESKTYNKMFKDIYGEDIFKDPNNTYDKMAQAIGEFEKTKQFAPFDSKYDRYLKGEYDLTPLEDLGRTLFFSNNNVNCNLCHTLKREDAPRETFTNYQYHNIGTPQNKLLMAKNVVDEKTFIDHGLMNNPHIKNLPNAKEFDGEMKVPTLRNVAVTGPYMHNGVFEKLSTVIKFYDKYNNPKNTINPETGKPWAKPEVEETINRGFLTAGKAMNERKVQALVAFLNTLTDKQFEHLIKEDN
jgi:cytochrome c peroxidase